MRFNVVLAPKAVKDLAFLLKNQPDAYRKALKLIGELYEHPRTGTGKPEQLKGGMAKQWSRRITREHRWVYSIDDKDVHVDVLSSKGHYDDK